MGNNETRRALSEADLNYAQYRRKESAFLRKRNNRMLVFYRVRNKMASVSLRGTRKTYSFEERKILISLINKHVIVEDRKSDPISICKRKSAWSRIADEYNSMVGPQGARSAMQLRRCWENMKACKRLRDEKRSR